MVIMEDATLDIVILDTKPATSNWRRGRHVHLGDNNHYDQCASSTSDRTSRRTSNHTSRHTLLRHVMYGMMYDVIHDAIHDVIHREEWTDKLINDTSPQKEGMIITEDATLDIVILNTKPAISDCNESDQLHLVDHESQTLVDGWSNYRTVNLS